MSKLKNVLALTLALFAFHCLALDLTSAEVIVKDQSQSSWNQAVQQGFAEVMVKLSGRSDVMRVAKIAKAQEQASLVVSSYRYLSATPLRPHIDFDADAMRHTLKNADVPVWSADRPLVMIWLMHIGEGRPELVGGDMPIAERMQIQAKTRGLEVVLPLLDLQERESLDLAQIQSLNMEAIKNASKRYDADEIVVGLNKGRQTTWVWITPAGSLTWNSEDDTLAETASHGIDHIVSHLASQLNAERLAGPSTDVSLAVTGVKQLRDYAKLMDYLRSIDGVGRVQVKSVSEDSVVVQLAVEGGRHRLEQTLGQSRQLMVELDPPMQLLADRVYRWMNLPGTQPTTIQLG